MNSKFFISDDKTKLSYFDGYLKNSKIAVIIVHGLAEHKGRYEEFMERLNQNGISVFALDLRGHGQSEGKRGDVNCFDEYINDLGAFIQHLKNEHPDLKIALFGHSIGGLISAYYTAQNKNTDLLILSSPSFETPSVVKWLHFLPKILLHKINIKKRYSESKEMLQYSRKDPYACHQFSLGLLKVVFIDGVKRMQNSFHKIDLPTLMLGGRLDPLVDSGKLEGILKKFGSQDKTIILYKNAKHRIVQNEAKDESIPAIITWLKERA